jgi:redox-sensitive bicupin YhaK (pirin superfamily)
MTESVIAPLPASPSPWPTVDPFLFCVHHNDRYPPGDGRMAPAASLAGRRLGQDFAGIDGWNMYHGSTVPGFPQHPHRGFETITFARNGYIDHSDSLGAAARFGRGDVQWMTAGRGIVHAEMFPLLDSAGTNHVELFQIWMNLPASDKMVSPYFSMLWNEEIPRVELVDGRGLAATITVIAGRFNDATPPPPPPASWASRAEADVAIWHVVLEAGARCTLPPANAVGAQRTLYVFEGAGLTVGTAAVANSSAFPVEARVPTSIVAGIEPVELLVLQGRPIAEPVAQYGPFVMNTEAEIRLAFEDYRRSGFGGWPWDDDAPVHPADRGRFARHADGRVEQGGVTAVG